MTFDEYLKKSGYKEPVLPTFEEWMIKHFDADGNGVLKGREKTLYLKAAKDPTQTAQLMGLHQSETERIRQQAAATKASLREDWMASEAGQNVEAQSAAKVENLRASVEAAGGKMGEKSGKNTLLLVAAAALLLLLIK